MPNLSELRISLAAARVTLRQAKDELETAKAIAETNYIMTLGGTVGKNEAERERNLIIGLSGSSLYRDALSYLRESEALIDQLQATIAIEEDTIRIEELRVREKLADALLGRREDNAATDYGAMRAFSGAMNHMDDDDLGDAYAESQQGTYNGTVPSDHMSHGDPNSDYPNSDYYAAKPRPKPNYAMLADGELSY